MQITGKIVCTAEDEHREEAKELASRLDIPFAAADAFSEDCDEILQLRVDERGLSMARGGMRLQCDLTKLLPRLRYNNLTHELVVRAAKNKDMQNSPFAIDATAGFGEDALLLAAAGFTVEMYEKDRIIAALLEDGLRRAARVRNYGKNASAQGGQHTRHAESGNLRCARPGDRCVRLRNCCARNGTGASSEHCPAGSDVS